MARIDEVPACPYQQVEHLLTSKWVGVRHFGNQDGAEEEAAAVLYLRNTDTASR
jgi:hypothetical protein